MPDEIKNCPFCGNKPKSVDMYPALVECETPGCILEYETFRRDAWNTRPAESRLESELLSLRKASHSVSQCCPESERLAKRVEDIRGALPSDDEIESYSAFATEIQADETEAASLIRVMCIKFRQARAAAESFAARGAGR